MAKKYSWNVKLRPNAFTPDNDRDQLADVEPNGATKHDEEQGVFFVDSSGTEHKVTRKLTVNKPSQLIARVPTDVAEGSVSLVVRTKYSGSANVLKTLRELRYAYELKAVMAD